MKIKEGEFISLDYTGSLEGKIFDVTDEKIAKKEKIYRESTKYGPVTVVVSAGHLIKGLDKALVGREVGEEFEVDVQPEDAFGKRNPKLIKMIPESAFRNQKLKPSPGMQLNIDGILATVMSVSGGRIVIDFNHPLSGKVLKYKVKIHKKIEDKKEQILLLLELYSGKDKEKFHVSLEDKKAEISLTDGEPLPEKVKEIIEKDIKTYVGIEKVEFTEHKGKSEKEAKEE